MTPAAIYLDYHATTPLDPGVFEAMRPWWQHQFGNAGSLHRVGYQTARAVEFAAESLAGNLGCTPDELVFTSGATESCNLAIKGLAERMGRRRKHLVSVTTEHPAVLDPLERLTRQGFEVTLLAVDREGQLDLDALADALRPETLLVSVMLANNEVGTIAPLPEIAAICHAHGCWLHSDATQAVGKLPVNVDELGVDLLSFSAQKLCGPQGIGALFGRQRERRVRLAAQIDGGGQQRGLRSGTLPVALIVGLAAAVRIAIEAQPEEQLRVGGLRDALWKQLAESLPGIELNGPPLEDRQRRLANNLNIAIPGVDAGSVLAQTERLAASTGSACSSTDPSPSHVLLALGHDVDRVRGSLRFGLGRFTQEEELAAATALVTQAVGHLRQMAR